MIPKYKSTEDILQKMKIAELNEMQKAAFTAIYEKDEIVLLSPTGTGKTLAFLLPIIQNLDPDEPLTQVLILVPARELAIQIEQVLRDMGTGYKVNAVFGGVAGSKDKIILKNPPAILIGTPGRVADHIRHYVIDTKQINTLVFDEFDKSLEVGFEEDMIEILNGLPNIKKKVLTSATSKVKVPKFVGLKQTKHLNFLDKDQPQIQKYMVISQSKDKLNKLNLLLQHIGKGRGIIFCNFKDTLFDVADYLEDRDIPHACFYGGMEQIDREQALIKFRNGTSPILLATDLAARGIDVPALTYIMHFEIPMHHEDFIHRNGRTARMHEDGVAYVLKYVKDQKVDFLKDIELLELQEGTIDKTERWHTLYITGGRKDKISKGDIAGLFLKKGQVLNDALGVIELKQNCAYVAVHADKSQQLVNTLNNSRLKKKKVRISVLK